MTTLTKNGDTHVLTIEGELNKSAVADFQKLVDQAVGEDARDFVVDFTDCTGLDSTALEALTRLHRETQERLGMCKLCMLSETMEKIFEITRLNSELDICVTFEEALAALK